MSFTVDRRAVNRAMLTIAALAAAPIGIARAAERRIDGTALYRERIALPDNAELIVRLLDTTLPESPPTTVAETSVAPAGQVPIAFSLAYDEALIEPGHSYALEGEILAGDEIIFASQEPVPHEPDAAGQNVELLLVRQSREGAALPAEIVGAEWQVRQIEGFALADGVVSTLVLNERGTAGGNGGCNRFFATLTVSGEALSFSEIGSTFMACEEKAMAQEQAYFQALAHVASYRMDEGHLQLLDPEGRIVIVLGLLA